MIQCIVSDCTKPKHKYSHFCAMHRWRIYKYGCIDGVKWPQHHDYRSPENNTWRSMQERCYSPNSPNYKDYGGRGITICDRWRTSYINFLHDMGRKPEGSSLDRIDNTKGYSPENCRWASTHEQIANRRRKGPRVGVFFTNQYQTWEAQLKINGKFVFRKKFKTMEDAIAAREAAEVLYLGHKLT